MGLHGGGLLVAAQPLAHLPYVGLQPEPCLQLGWVWGGWFWKASDAA